jgi:hypothetical protein
MAIRNNRHHSLTIRPEKMNFNFDSDIGKEIYFESPCLQGESRFRWVRYSVNLLRSI